MERTEVDGVPVFWTDGPAPYAAGLVFGVGRRDETFLHGGLTHLVEHLVMASLGRSTLEANASVDLYVTEFTASGFADPDDGCREQIAATYPQLCAGPGPAPRLVALHARLAQGRDVPGEGQVSDFPTRGTRLPCSTRCWGHEPAA